MSTSFFPIPASVVKSSCHSRAKRKPALSPVEGNPYLFPTLSNQAPPRMVSSSRLRIFPIPSTSNSLSLCRERVRVRDICAARLSDAPHILTSHCIDFFCVILQNFLPLQSQERRYILRRDGSTLRSPRWRMPQPNKASKLRVDRDGQYRIPYQDVLCRKPSR
jgi:hypothetical protein